MTSKRHCGNGAGAVVVTPSAATRAALQTQLDATGFRPEIFKCFGDPWGARRAMYFLTHNELLACAASCVILKEWSGHYVWGYTFDRRRTEMPLRTAEGRYGRGIEIGDVPLMMARIAPRFANLRTVRLNGAGLASFPTEIGALTGLTEMSLEMNQLTSLPSEIRALTG